MTSIAPAEPTSQAKSARQGQQGRKLRFEGTRMACPMCKAQAQIRTSAALTSTMRETMYQCINVECGCTFVANTEIVRLLNPGATPDPDVRIPLSRHVRRAAVRDMLDHGADAEHRTRFSLPGQDEPAQA